jgi:hypothetical protein
MFKKIALAAALIAGTASFAFAEGDSTIGIYGPNGQAASQERSAPTFANRNVGLGAQVIVRDAQGAGYDRASSPYAGGGF